MSQCSDDGHQRVDSGGRGLALGWFGAASKVGFSRPRYTTRGEPKAEGHDAVFPGMPQLIESSMRLGASLLLEPAAGVYLRLGTESPMASVARGSC